MRCAIYNSCINDSGIPNSSSRRLLKAGLLVIVCLSGIAAASDSDWSVPEGQLASKIAAVTGPGAVSLDVTNRSSLTAAECEEIGRGLRAQMEARGLRFVSAEQAAAKLDVALSEDLQNYVWIGEIHQAANESSVVMISIPRSGSPVFERDTASVIIHKALISSQAQRVLDMAIMDGNPTHMAVLDASQVALYRLDNGRWQPEHFLAIAHVRPWPRDLRGRLMLRKDHLLDVYLPGVFCRSSTNPLALDCRDSDDPWPLSTDQSLAAFFTPSRNYFTGALAPGIGKQTMATPFYTAAPLPRDKYTLWLTTGVDGQVHLLDGVTDQTAGKLDWGGDIASVHSACGLGWNIVATDNHDLPADTLRVFDVPDREPFLVSQPAEFRGPITALWAEVNGNTAIAVSRNAQTGDYEAYRLSFTCGQ